LNAFTLWFTGLSGSGKTTLANGVKDRLYRLGVKEVELLDGDVIRTNLSKELGFSKEDRDTNILRIGWVCQLLNKHGINVIVAAISPYGQTRRKTRRMIDNFVEIYVKCPIDILIKRDTKGLYQKALNGEIKNFTGISDPYEEPIKPEIIVETDKLSIKESLVKINAQIMPKI